MNSRLTEPGNAGQIQALSLAAVLRCGSFTYSDELEKFAG
jgi:hypothetical protein